MRIEYICHACLEIDTGDTRLLTDPWFMGSAYCEQWVLFPRPVRTELTPDVIVISHGHEDHLHRESLQHLPPSACVLFPYYWFGGIQKYMRALGYADVRELYNFRTHRLTPRTSVTFVSNYLDSVIVVESNGYVLVDVNDALHASHANIIEIFLAAIRARWPRVDAVFSGFGGANYFPNSVHVVGKDDIEIGRLREQVFVHNFCRIVRGLQPRLAVPFAADFALLDPGKLWINNVRFPRERIASYYREHFGNGDRSTRIVPMYPGDVLVGDTVEPRSPYREQLRDGGLWHLLQEQYGVELEARRHPACIDAASAGALAGEIARNVGERRALVPDVLLRELVFCVRVTDVASENCYNVRCTPEPVVVRSGSVDPACAIVVETSSRILRHSFARVWGGDAFIIGYGCEVYYRRPDDVETKLDRVVLKLLTQLPEAKRHMLRREPWRAVKYVASNPTTRKWVGAYLRRRSQQDAISHTNVWLRRTKCEICEVCDIPLLDDDFAARLGSSSSPAVSPPLEL